MARGRFAATAGAERPGLLAIVALLVLPALVSGLLSVSLAAPASRLDRLTAAIVNEDLPATVDDPPLGRQFAARLLAAQEPAPAQVAAPSATDTGEPAAVNGTRASASPSAEPSSFTWVLTNAGEAQDGLAAGRYGAVLTIPRDFSAAAASLGGLPSEARQAKLEIQTSARSAWVDPALARMVGERAAAVLGEQLTSRYLADVYAGFTEINTRIETASTGAAELSGAADSLARGSTELAAGLAELESAVSPLPADTEQLADDAGEVVDDVFDASDRVRDGVVVFSQTVAAICETPGPVCDRARDDLDALQSAARQVAALTTGASAVADGNALLAASMPDLVSGVDGATSGAEQVSQGAEQADAGARQLSQGLADADGRIPSYTDDDVAVLTAVAARPVVVEMDQPAPATPALPLFVMLALWIGAIAIALVAAAVPPRRLLTGASTMAIAGTASVRVLALGAGGGVAAALVAGAAVSFPPGPWAAFVVASAYVGAVFALVNQALVAVAGATGRLIAVVIGVLGVAAAVSSTVPPVVSALGDVLPTGPGLALLGAALTGPDSAVWRAEAILALFAAVSLVLVLGATAARRGEREAQRHE